jgi:hypothetical protein
MPRNRRFVAKKHEGVRVRSSAFHASWQLMQSTSAPTGHSQRWGPRGLEGAWGPTCARQRCVVCPCRSWGRASQTAAADTRWQSRSPTGTVPLTSHTHCRPSAADSESRGEPRCYRHPWLLTGGTCSQGRPWSDEFRFHMEAGASGVYTSQPRPHEATAGRRE